MRGSGQARTASAGLAFLLVLGIATCGDGTGPGSGDPGPDGRLDVPADTLDETAIDLTPTDLPPADLPPDVPPPPDPPFVPPDAALRARYATRDLPVPLGISTAGFLQTPAGDAPTGPFADAFQATVTLLHPPRVQALQILANDRRLLLVTGDLIAIFRTLESRVIQRVLERTGVDVSGVMVLAGNHSHSGPGRLFDTPLGLMFSDSYREESFLPVADAIADAIVDAMAGPSVPVRLGNAVLQNGTMHGYRRCPDFEVQAQDDTMHVVRLERVGVPDETLAVVLNYAMHGTVLGAQTGMLGGDAPRSVELKVQEVLPGAPPVMFFQSWSGDMAPTDPRETFAGSPWPEAPLPALDLLEALGRLAAETVLAGWNTMTWQEHPELIVTSAVAPMGVEAIGYADGEWDHPAGALLCGGGGSICSATPPAMDSCLDVDYGWIPDTVRLTAFRLGTLAGVTLPGEPHTPLAMQLIQRVKDRVRPIWNVMVFGYAHDYVGYLMLPDDYANGGYEPGMAFFGPRQGEYLRDAAASLAARLSNPDAPLAFVPMAPTPWSPGAVSPYTPDVSLDPGAAVQDLPPQAVAGDVLTFTWKGGDPWVDHPEVVLEHDAAAAEMPASFEPLRAGGRIVDQRDYRVLLGVTPNPPWDQPAPGGRTFTWAATLRTAVRIPAPDPALSGTLRISVAGTAAAANGAVAPYALQSSPVVVTLPP